MAENNPLSNEALKKIIAKMTRKKSPAMLKKFAEIYLQGTPEREISGMMSDHLIQHIEESYAYFKKWSSKPMVRVFNAPYTKNTIAQIHMKDQPFIVDSIWGEINRRGYEIHHTFHPVLGVKRDSKNTVKAFAQDSYELQSKKGYQPESFVHIEFDYQDDADVLAEIEQSLEIVMDQAIQVTLDFQKMFTRMASCTAELESTPKSRKDHEEEVAFFKWLMDGNFIFLGYRHYDITRKLRKTFMGATEGSGLGLMHDDSTSSLIKPVNVDDLPLNLKHYISSNKLLTLTKTLNKSAIHRHVGMDYIGIKEFNKKGQLVGEHRFVGLLTSRAYTTSPHKIPMVRQKIEAVLQREDRFAPSTHNYKALANILETYPMDELFQITTDDLHRISTGILNLKERQQVRFFARHSRHERTVMAMVFIPRDRMTTGLRHKIIDILGQSYNAEDVEYVTTLGESLLARIFLKIRSKPPCTPNIADRDVETLLIDAARSWTDDLQHQLTEVHGEAKGRRLFKHYGSMFRAGYQENTAVENAVQDIHCLEALNDEHKDFMINMGLSENKEFHLKLFNKNTRIQLSDIMPMFDNMGLQIADENATKIQSSKRTSVWIHDFEIQVKPEQKKLLNAQTAKVLSDALEQSWYGKMESDNLNRLIVAGGLDVRQVVILRALLAYLQQIGLHYSREYVQNTLIKHADIAAKLVDLFDARFNPNKTDKQRSSGQRTVSRQIEKMLADVKVLDEDVIIQRLMSVINAMVRTNAWQRKEPTDPICFKIRSSEVEGLVKPHPLFEIYVYHSLVEGVHLRGGMVARGGLRWSDRPADFRTEVLGLMKTQMTKNAVIVPVGSKGGFVLKDNPCKPELEFCDRDALMKKVVEAYSTFIGCLISVTDNRKGDEIVPPRAVVRHDAEDPYLVVAADKGTATFSDIANGISEKADYWDGIKGGFWLGDAFASGGSNGYDHKKMGITARGAWECVKHHFRGLEKDIQNQEFTAIGIGDMAGDVFGNGMLLSKKTKLQAAFNHLFIFIDPEPDAAKTWAERDRLFKNPRLNWGDYNTKLISKGGGIFSRSEKQIKLTPQIQKMLGVKVEKMTPDDLIKAILKMDVELLWNGGIGTFIKATSETHAEVRDRANDMIRVDATEIKAKVIGEGGNLGLTQRARIEYALNGGFINTDAIDNSAGVDCSDHEVNIKILLGMAKEKKVLSMKARNALLEAMTDEVGILSLTANYRQAKILNIAEKVSLEAIDTQIRLIKGLEKKGLLDPAIEFLPDEETMEQRRKDKIGLTRPELSVVMAYAKSELYNNLLETKLPEEGVLKDYLYNYFPKALQDKYKPLMDKHPLKREIVSTVISNEVINRMGLTFIDRMRDETGHPECTITRSFLIAEKLYGASRWWDKIDELDNKVPATTQRAMRQTLKKLIEATAFWFLRNQHERPLNIQSALDRFADPIAQVVTNLEKHMTPLMQQAHNDKVKVWTSLGLDKETATQWSLIERLKCAPDVAQIAINSDCNIGKAMDVHFHIGESMKLGLLHERTREIPTDDNWQRVASLAIREGLFAVQLQITCQSLANHDCKKPTDTIYTAWKNSKTTALDRYFSLVDEVEGHEVASHAMMNVVLGQLRGLVG